MPSAIRIQNVSKHYQIGQGRSSGSLREAITGFVFRRSPEATSKNEIWAVRDVTLNIPQGEVIGIIGRNGAGKSTLLKLLSRITAPTSGRIEVAGQIASLLEVGTGFHPELTGRENIYLNGSILGMSRANIRRKFDEIVAFAEMERFLDTPVKFYSSGMHVRLGFAVAAHLESDILLLDEVLAVGDVAFQKKCLSKMGDAAGHGRTVVFISHNMSAVRQLCTRTVLIDGGRVVADGPTSETLRVFSERLRSVRIDANTHIKDRLENHSGSVRFTHFAMEDASGKERYDFQEGESMRVRVNYEVFDDVSDLCVFFALSSEDHEDFITSVRHILSKEALSRGKKGSALIEFSNNALLSREYHPYVWLGSTSGRPYDRINYHLTSCPPLIISPRDLDPDHARGYFTMPSRLIAG